MKELSKITNLNWSEKQIICYVVGKAIPFSDPLTLLVYKKIDYAVDMLTHELIHRLFTQKSNQKKMDRLWVYFDKKYKKENDWTINHAVLYAIHRKIYLTLFNEKRMKRDVRKISHLKYYKKAWEIAQKDHEEILKKLT